MVGEEERDNDHEHIHVHDHQQRNLIPESNLDLDLTLALPPINSHPPQPPPQNTAFCYKTLSKRDVQALRRLQAKKKRDLKRKGQYQWASLRVDRQNKQNNEAAYWPCDGGAGGGFRPYLRRNGEGENRESASSGSSSGVSLDCPSTSSQGGNNSSVNTSSHSSHSHSQLSASTVQTASDSQPSSSNPSSSSTQLCSSSSNQLQRLSSSAQSGAKSSSPEGVTSSNSGKPPKPSAQRSQQKQMVSQMPYVSATGNGPNGKTVTGFLYRYTNAEVSIVCVCHGASFTPTGFVEHAGGVEVEHPLRHIRVVPFSLG